MVNFTAVNFRHYCKYRYFWSTNNETDKILRIAVSNASLNLYGYELTHTMEFSIKFKHIIILHLTLFLFIYLV